MEVELRICNRNPAHPEFETVERDVPAYWPVPRAGEYITLDTTDHPTVPEGEMDISFLKVNTVDYILNDMLQVKKIIIISEPT